MWARPYLTGILLTPVRLSARWTPVRWVALQPISKSCCINFIFVVKNFHHLHHSLICSSFDPLKFYQSGEKWNTITFPHFYLVLASPCPWSSTTRDLKPIYSVHVCVNELGFLTWEANNHGMTQVFKLDKLKNTLKYLIYLEWKQPRAKRQSPKKICFFLRLS